MAASLHSSRYQREQRFTVLSWAVLVVAGALSVAAYQNWSTARSASADADAAPPAAPTLTMHAWLEHSEQSINGMVIARNKIAAAAARQDVLATGAACQAAGDAVANLRDHMPSPEAMVNQPLQQAISSYTLGLPECLSASRTEGGEGLQRAASLIRMGDNAMQSALDLLADGPDAHPGQLGMLIV